jgi:hypothetical protein
VTNPRPTRTSCRAQEDRIGARTELEVLEDAYPDWKHIVGPSATASSTPSTRSGRGSPRSRESYQQKINDTNNARVIERAIDRFKAYEAEQAKR